MDEITGGLILVMFKYTCSNMEPGPGRSPGSEEGSCLDEAQDKDLFEPDGVRIAYVLSNFCNKYHPDYVNLSKEAIETNKQKFKEFNSNRGRKKKEKKKKNKKKNNGTNDEFGSCITFGVIYSNRIHGVKMFRKESGNISKLTYYDIDESNPYVPNMLGVLFDFINEFKQVNITYESHYIALANITGKYKLPEDSIINLYLLRDKTNLGRYTPEYWGCRNIIYDFNGKVNHFKFIISENFDNRTIGIKLSPEGKIHVYGSSNNVTAGKYMATLIKLLDEHRDTIIIRGIRASTKPKPRPDFTKELCY
jgi:hypothetical protein